jgi:molybdopterin-guanine dinucleotide biosynthesis protein B
MENEFYPIIENKPHVFIVGKKNQGKTRVVQQLIKLFSAKGYRVAAWKHSSHHHPVDKPGSDSDKFRQSGAMISIFQSLNGMGFYLPPNGEEFQSSLLQVIIKQIDILFIESFSSLPGPKILVYRDQIPDLLPDNIIATIGSKSLIQRIPNFTEVGSEIVQFLETRWFKE